MRRGFVALKRSARNFNLLRLSVGLAVASLCYIWLAQAAAAQAVNIPDTKLAGINWGIGLAADFDLGGTRVNTATVVNNIVRVTDSSNNVNVGFVLEAHYFFKAVERCYNSGKPAANKDAKPDNLADALSCTDFATGPFVAIEIGGGTNPAANGGLVTGYALGWMIGFRHPDFAKMMTPSSTWNLGIGLRVDPKSQVLGDGIIANQPLPIGESPTLVRLKTEPRYGLMLLSSFTF
ncbi:MAG TPA: hypothetical protein VKS24_14285 [Bradyrhizobium sp.]|nr:hypothetical protein [Bradyrhizobium sp.]